MKRHGGILKAHTSLSKRHHSEKSPYCMIPTPGHSGKGGGSGQSTEDCEGSENSLHDTAMVAIRHHTSVQSSRVNNLKSERQV